MVGLTFNASRVGIALCTAIRLGGEIPYPDIDAGPVGVLFRQTDEGSELATAEPKLRQGDKTIVRCALQLCGPLTGLAQLARGV